MAEPSTWIVRLECDDEIPGAWHHCRVPAGWVAGVEGRARGGVRSRAGRQHKEVVTVQVDGVGDRKSGLDDKVVPLIGVRQLDDGRAVAEG